ncbi:transglutaminase superfamily protein [Dyadobacter jejuensis]|uniref:Transglutaminase superfamily protein n=1 Tax=Dyadobacter jejuensis TaxID=1082580 RepID=A0A316AAT4_9BACT|nr:transglutaminase-like domain-containing protein [Dyadobacter jejuensis]PWJ54519.1 transglutaminase superfamily protein [Dyadobacter jejuensis]
MNKNEIKALISLLDDEDHEVSQHVEGRILSLGGSIIPLLETEWENSFNPTVQHRIEELIHELQQSILMDRLQTWRNSGGQDLMEGMWIVATYLYPDLTLEELNVSVEQLYYDIWTQFQDEMNPVDQIKRINGVFFGDLNFSANTKNFHSPSNSMINIVLETKKGNPITLCVIYLLIAHKLKLPIYGVNLPNLFVLTYKKDQVQFYINVFSRGIIFSKTDIDHYIAQLNIKPKDIFYQPCTNLEIIQRVLRNLLLSYEKTGDHEKKKELENILRSTMDHPLE